MRFLQCIFILIPCYCFSQADSILECSRLEKMIMQPRSFVNVSSRTLGEAYNLAVGVLTATDLNDGKKQRSAVLSPLIILVVLFFLAIIRR